MRRGSPSDISSDTSRVFSPQRNSQIGLGDGWAYREIPSSASSSNKGWEVANLLEEYKGHRDLAARDSQTRILCLNYISQNPCGICKYKSCDIHQAYGQVCHEKIMCRSMTVNEKTTKPSTLRAPGITIRGVTATDLVGTRRLRPFKQTAGGATKRVIMMSIGWK